MLGKLSKTQKEILSMYLDEFLTTKQIAKRRQKTYQAVQKIKLKLIEKGYLKRGFKGGFKNQGPPAPNAPHRYIRWHGLQFSIKILQSSEYYKKEIKKSNGLKYVKGHTCVLYENKIEVYQQQGGSFTGKTVDEAFTNAIHHFNRVFGILENDLKILLLKDRHQNIKLSAGHCAEVNNEVAIEYNNANEKVTIYGTDDGKAWFKIDASWQLNEAETIHPQTNKADAQVIFGKQLNAWRDNPDCPTTPELARLVEANATQLKYYGENWRSHVKFVQEATYVLKQIKGELKGGRFLYRSPKQLPLQQRLLQDYI